MTKLWLLWTQDGTLDSTQRKDTLIFACRSTCCWAFAKITSARHELIRVRNDYNCLMGNSVTEPEIELFKVQWRMPHVALYEINKLSSEHWKTVTIWVFAHGICTSILCYRIRSSIYELSKWRLNLRNRNILSLFCRPIERMLCHELACSTIVI